jgi:cyclohexyl-isocyanide hydratase
MNVVPEQTHLNVGGVLFPDLDQGDFTGPFEVLSRLPNSTFHVLAKTRGAVRDTKGLVLMPEKAFSEAGQLDVLLVPGGAGVNAAMEDDPLLSFIRAQAPGAKCVLSVCTGALVCGAAGLLNGRRATTHWASRHLLKHFDAIPIDERVVVDGNLVTTAGVTAGMDGALKVAALLRGERVAQELQLYIEYAPEPPFNCGTPKTAPAEIVRARREALQGLLEERLETINRVSKKVEMRKRLIADSLIC